MNPIYDYLDYRRFLKDRFLELKNKNSLFSYRSFNRLAGVKSSGFLKLVIDKKRNLADNGIRMISRGLKLNEHERKYFEILVKFNQAKTNEEKDYHFQELSKKKKFISAKPMTVAQYHLLSNWYCVAILELIRAETRELKNIDWISQHLNPLVELREIKKGVEILKQLGLLYERKNGQLIRREGMLTTEDEVNSISAANFHVQMSQLAGRAVMQEQSGEREFSTLTIITSEKSFQRAKQEIQRFRKSLHSILEQEKDGTKKIVAHLNLQLFKLSDKVD